MMILIGIFLIIIRKINNIVITNTNSISYNMVIDSLFLSSMSSSTPASVVVFTIASITNHLHLESSSTMKFLVLDDLLRTSFNIIRCSRSFSFQGLISSRTLLSCSCSC